MAAGREPANPPRVRKANKGSHSHSNAESSDPVASGRAASRAWRPAQARRSLFSNESGSPRG